jgi:erythromycin esterase-like protein
MRVIGFALGDGNYTAYGPRGLSPYPAASPPLGSVEDVFRASGLPRFALDLRDVSRAPASAWLAAPHDFRSIGAMAMDSGFNPARVAAQYDAVIYFDHTTASAVLRNQIRP